MGKWLEEITDYIRTNTVALVSRQDWLPCINACGCSQPNVFMGAQLRGSCFCLNYQMVSWCTGLKENQFWCSFPSQGGFAYKLEPPHAHLVSLPLTHPAGLTSALACATYHLLLWKRGPRISTLLPVKPELQHLVDTESASCNPAWTTRLTGQALHLLPLSFQCALWSNSPKW